MSRLAVLGSYNFSNIKLLDGVLDLYLYEDPDLHLITYQGEFHNAHAFSRKWAIKRNIPVSTHAVKWENVPDFGDEMMLRCNTDLICDADESVIFWNGTDDFLIPSFDIAQGQQMTQVIYISNNEIDCEIYDND